MNCANPYLATYDRFDSHGIGYKVHRYVPCGRCYMCRKRRSKDWQFRLQVEHQHNKIVTGNETYFVTLTYAPEFYPHDSNINYRDIQLFLKSLRHYFTFRFFCVRDYGYNNTMRGHWHLLFYPTSSVPPNIRDIIHELWAKGRTQCDLANEKRVNYCANYTSMCVPRSSRFRSVCHMSLRPGIGFSYFLSDEFYDCYVKGNFSLQRIFERDGQVIRYKQSIPRYYRRKLNDVPPTFEEELISANNDTREYELKPGYYNSSPYNIMNKVYCGYEFDGYNLYPRCVSYSLVNPKEIYEYIDTKGNTKYYSKSYFYLISDAVEKFRKSHSNRNIQQQIDYNPKHLERWLTFFSRSPYGNRNAINSTLATNAFAQLSKVGCS